MIEIQPPQHKECPYIEHCRHTSECPEENRYRACERYWDNKHLDEVFEEMSHLFVTEDTEQRQKLFGRGWRL